MLSFSRFIARRLAGVLAAAFVLVAFVGPAHAATIAPSKVGKNMVSANNVQSVVDYLVSKGDMTTRDDSDAGNPMLTQVDNLYDVFFDCEDDHTNCSAIQFRSCYSDYPDANLDKTNALNRDFFFAKSYIDSDGNACVELPVATGVNGISYEAMDRAYDAFLWFRQNTDEEFGPEKPESE